MSTAASILIQAVGNPLRSDDGVGPRLIDALASRLGSRAQGVVDLEWVYQLQIEHAEQWCRYERVIVVDAETAAAPIRFREIAAQGDCAASCFSSHQQSPEALYQLMLRLFPPAAGALPARLFVLGIRAEAFGLGEGLGTSAAEALLVAEQYLLGLLDGWMQES